jgi:hypothetical protein
LLLVTLCSGCGEQPHRLGVVNQVVLGQQRYPLASVHWARRGPDEQIGALDPLREKVFRVDRPADAVGHAAVDPWQVPTVEHAKRESSPARSTRQRIGPWALPTLMSRRPPLDWSSTSRLIYRSCMVQLALSIPTRWGRRRSRE